MCARFTREYTWRQIHDLMDVRMPAPEDMTGPGLDPSWNVAPTQHTGVLHAPEHAGPGTSHSPAAVTVTVRRWGLIPGWARDLTIASKTINARSETAAEKPSFRDAFRRRRCVVPISSFYEWADPPPGSPKNAKRRPYRVLRADGHPMLLAGLYEDPRPDLQEGSFTVLTTHANDFMAELHPRMPVILEPETAPSWIDPALDLARAPDLLRPAADGVLDRYTISTRVNSPRENDPGLITPKDPDEPEPGEQRSLFG